MEEEYISLYIQDVLLEDDKKLLDYPLSYHCIIVLEYVNPNIVFKVKFNDTVSTFTMDYSKPVSDIIKEFMNVLIIDLIDCRLIKKNVKESKRNEFNYYHMEI